VTHSIVGRSLRALGRRDEARAAFEAARAAFERVPRSHYLSFRAEGDLADCYYQLAALAVESGRFAEARTAYESVVRVARRRAEAYPADIEVQSRLVVHQSWLDGQSLLKSSVFSGVF
jgi:tetratricopeptide (TPR) repeat protein